MLGEDLTPDFLQFETSESHLLGFGEPPGPGTSGCRVVWGLGLGASPFKVDLRPLITICYVSER